jgi:hypothetical protein
VAPTSNARNGAATRANSTAVAPVSSRSKAGFIGVTIVSHADFVSPENFKRILRRRYEMSEGKENVFDRDLARALVEIAQQWVKVDEAAAAELRRLAGKLPSPTPGLTRKNKDALRQFDDPQVLHRLVSFPRRAWAEVKKSPRHDRYILAKAHTFSPISNQNCALLSVAARPMSAKRHS